MPPPLHTIMAANAQAEATQKAAKNAAAARYLLGW